MPASAFPKSNFAPRVYMAAVCRCFPGKNPNGGDRVPNRAEKSPSCGDLAATGNHLLKPELIIPVGKLAIAQMLKASRASTTSSARCTGSTTSATMDAIPLPHPSGLSTWFKLEPGKSLLQQALRLIGAHPTWETTFR
jgi:uracil-DNA glycosylase